MATPKDNIVRFNNLAGGQNSADPPTAIAESQVTIAQNVEYYRTTLGRKRRGSRLLQRLVPVSQLPTNVKFVTLAGVPDPNYPGSLTGIRIVLEDANHAWYSWGYGGTPWDWTICQVADTPTTNACVVYFNGAWFAAYKSSVNRLHLLGPGGTSSIRTGLAAPATPTITPAAGAVTDSRRYRSVVYHTATGWRSEPSAETSTQVLAAQQASASAPGAAPATEAYNQWELQAASDDDNFATWWVVGNAGPTTAIVDNNTSLTAFEPANEVGLFETQHSAKFLGVDNNRVLLAGHYEDTSDVMQHRVWFTPILGDRDEGDSVRIVDTASIHGWVDLDAGDGGGAITGFGPTTLGDVLVFKEQQVWRLVKTGNAEAPYIPRAITKTCGTFGYRTICAGHDATGRACVYFASWRGPYRVGAGGEEYLGYAIEDIWATVNQHGNAHTSQHATYYQDRGQYWLWVSVDGETVPSVLLIFHVRTGGWSVYTGPHATAQCSALLARYVEETGHGITTSPSPQTLTAPYVPYCCPNTNGQIAECDAINPQTGVALDTDLEVYSGSGSVWTNGTTYQAYIRTRPVNKTLDGFVTVQGATVLADAGSFVTLFLSILRDYGAEVRSFSASMTPSGSEVFVTRKFDAAESAEMLAVQFQIGDAFAVANQWAIHALQVRIQEEGPY